MSFIDKEPKDGFLSMLLGSLGATFLGNLLGDKGVIRADRGALRVRKNFNASSSFN